MKKKSNKGKAAIVTVIVITSIVSFPISHDGTGAAEKVTEITHGEASVLYERMDKRSKFTKQYAMSDGSFLANSHSMPIHYKKNGSWKEVDTTLIKGKKNYKTKSTSLGITVAKKANTKAEITLKRGSSKLSLALMDKKVKAKKAKISNPKKEEVTDILNSNQVRYQKAYKNMSLSYEIYPEKLVEKITVQKKSAVKKITLKVNSGNLKVKIKKNRVYFKTKKGTAKYKRLKTIITDNKGVSTSKVKIKYNKKKKSITLIPDRKWIKSKKRNYPMTVRTAYVSNQHERDVKIGAAYAGAPNSNYTYDESLLLQANKCVAFTQMSNLAELGQPNVKIRDACLYIKNEKALHMGAGKKFDVGIYKVTSKWSGKKVTNHKRPTYETEKAASLSLQKRGIYACDITKIVQSWYKGVPNYGVALAAENTNGTYQAALEKNPTFSIHYEVVGFDGAVELKENEDITRDVLKSGQENYYYFDVQPGIAYDLYTTSSLDTQGILYDADKERTAYDDDSGQGKNFSFISSYAGRRYLKVNVKGKETGKYTLSLKKRFERPEPSGKNGQDSYIISWDAVKNAKEYLVTVYSAKGKISETVVKDTIYEYVYTNETAGKTLAFTVTPRENEELKGEASRKIYNTNAESQWVYKTPMYQARTHFGSSVCGDNIYVLGGIAEGGQASKSMEVFDTKKEIWKKLSDYPGNAAGICDMALVTVGEDIYVLGGRTDDSTTAKMLADVYCYHTESGKWEQKASLPQKRTGLVATVCDGKIYAFARIGTTERVDIYDITEDTWTSSVKADTSINLQAKTIDGHIYVLRELKERNAVKAEMYWEEYLPEQDVYDNAGQKCPVNMADRYTYGAEVDGKVYMIKENETNEVICYDVYLDTWKSIPVTNLKKEKSELVSVGTILYSIGGNMNGFGLLDVVESYDLGTQQMKRVIDVQKDEIYELQVEAGQCKEDTDYVVTVRIDTKALSFEKASSFMSRANFEKGQDGVQLLKCSEKSGVLMFRLNGKMEMGSSTEAFQSIPVRGLADGKTIVRMQVEEAA